ncbi:MAG: tRNA pseudouridine(38-40) synthase TruA [Chitinophagales bacterium]
MIYFLHIGYNGSRYNGWQYQPNVPSVQERIEQTLLRIFKTAVTVYGCGRTDTGVHASQYFMHIQLVSQVDFDLKFRLNKNLPDDIAVYDVLEMDNGNHVRYDAISRTYDYFIHLQKDPILNQYSSYYELEDLDVDAMQKAAAVIMQYEDCKAICKQPHLHKHTRCTITESQLIYNAEQQRFRFTITANRFLKGMVRTIVYFLLKIGNKEMTLEEFEYLLANQIETDHKKLALPNGLYLSKVEYPYLSLPARNDFASFLKVGLEG